MKYLHTTTSHHPLCDGDFTNSKLMAQLVSYLLDNAGVDVADLSYEGSKTVTLLYFVQTTRQYLNVSSLGNCDGVAHSSRDALALYVISTLMRR